MSASHAIRATALHTPAPNRLERLDQHLFEIAEDGRIAAIHPPGSRLYAARCAAYAHASLLTTLPEDMLLLPGLADLHVHAPQFPQLGAALDAPLQDWLQTYTFPLEARYADTDFAARVYEDLVRTLLANGTTTAMYFATIHLPATCRLADICLALGQRALIGRVAMDHPEQCPAYYRDQSAESADADTRAFITYVRDLPGNERGLIRPVITPRFIPSCTDDLLARLGRTAQETGCHVQTHASESIWEQDHVLARCGKTDSAALAEAGLLGRRTILAHGVFLSDPDLDLIEAHGSGIAHCPLSNAYFGDAIFPLRRVLDRGVHTGLGTDIAGGASPSMLEQARHAIISSHHRENSTGPAGARISATEALYLATAGGGVALDLPIGLFEPGFHFDAIALRPAQGRSNLVWHPNDTAEDQLQRILYLASRADIARVWVGGRLAAQNA